MPYYYLELMTCGVDGEEREGRLLNDFAMVKEALLECKKTRFVVTELVVKK